MITPLEMIGLNHKRMPLKQVIQQMPNPTKANIRKLYGEIGVDIFEGKDRITILSAKEYKKEQSLKNKVADWWCGSGKLDYEEKDSINDLVLKYGYNKIFGTYEEIERKFGQEGLKAADIFKLMGSFRTGF